MSLTTTAPLVLPSGRHHSISHTDYTSPTTMQGQGQGPGPGAYYSRPLSSHGGGSSQGVAHLASPERAHSSHGFTKSLPGTTPQTPSYGQEIPQPPSSSHGYPATPLTGTGPYTSDSAGYYGISQTTELDPNMPSPPGTSDGRAPNFTPDGNPIVPVGISGGKMFQCRGYGECDKVFTRSEHLARHVRKHTGERPFPCHCGKAFSRLDNLRQHAATVHSDQSPLNDAMLNSLSPVHAALSANATKEQRKRGEIVQVPKNAVERPRQAETFRSTKGASPTTPYPAYPDGHTWDQQTRPRTGGTAYDYAFHSVDAVIDSGGPSRRPDSESEYGHFYDGPSKPPAPIPPPEPLNQVQFPYRPVSNGSIQHYAESEPPNSAHGPPESPMYTAPPVPQPNWSSPPPHTSYGASQDHRTVYHPTATPEGYRYPDAAQYGPPPGSSGSAYGYPNNYYGPSYAPPPTSSFGAYGPESPFSYSNSTGPPPLATPMAPHPHASALGSYQYPPQPALPSSGPLKRRLDEDTTNYIPVPQTNISSSGASASSLRKIPRISGPSLNMPIRALQEIPPPGQDDDQLWFPPTTERRSSLAISALLGSPVEDHKPRAPWGDASLAVGGGGGGAGGDMEEKAKALLGSAH